MRFCSISAQNHINNPNALLLFVAVCFDCDAGFQSTGHVGVTVYGFQNLNIQRFNQRVFESI